MLLDLLQKRCSVRKFSTRSVSDEVIEYILECGRLAPSGGNEQAWRFGVIKDPKTILAIAEAAWQDWIKSAPLLIVLCTEVIEDARGCRDVQKARFPEWAEAIEKLEKDFYTKIHQEEHQTKIPGTHMVLAALEYGVCSTWVSYFEVEKVVQILNLPDKYLPSEILVFGYPEGETKVRPKKNLAEIVFYK